jgi:hypothetical protein
LQGRAAPGRFDALEQPVPTFTGVKVFSTTLARDREGLSERITKWIRENPQIEIVDQVVRQSSDQEFHCLSILLFFREIAG